MNKPRRAWRPFGERRPRGGYSLMELLVTMVAIGILAAGLLTGLSAVRTTANRARTQQLVSRLHAQLIPRYEQYRTRRLPVDPSADLTPYYTSGGVPDLDPNSTNNTEYRYYARVGWRRIWALRELMRMEMPDNYTDLQFIPRYLRAGDDEEWDSREPFYPLLRYSFGERINRLPGGSGFVDGNQDGIDDNRLSAASAQYGSAERL